MEAPSRMHEAKVMMRPKKNEHIVRNKDGSEKCAG